MKKLLITCMLLLAVCVSDSARAQERITTTSTVSTSNSVEGFARDYVFSLLENYELQQSGKYYQLYVTSASKTNIHVALGLTSDKKFPST